MPSVAAIMLEVVQRRSVEPETWAVMAGRGARGPGAPLNVPPVLASTFELDPRRGYSRDDATPTWEAFEEVLGGLEGGEAVAFASGMGAVAAIFDLLAVGATVVLGDDCYQGVAGLAEAGAAQGRWRVIRVAVEDTPRWLELATTADLLWLESPSNPLLAVADLRALCAASRTADALVVVDSTMATPLVQRPLELGADFVVHSATKYLGGHSDLLLGAVVARSDERARALRTRRELAGATPGALEAYLAVRGIRTLPLRLERATASASALAARLAQHPRSRPCAIPGCPTIPPTPSRAASCPASARSSRSTSAAAPSARTPSADRCRSSATPRASAASSRRSSAGPRSRARPTCLPVCCA